MNAKQCCELRVTIARRPLKAGSAKLPQNPEAVLRGFHTRLRHGV
jgi:hypothetical protein